VTGLRCDRLGDGPLVVLVHGVGVGPWSYAVLARDLAADHQVVVAHRRGYGASSDCSPAPSLGAQVDDLLELAAGPAAFVGVSGGATLTLALALAHPDAVVAAVVHEPVVGALAPALHAELVGAADRLATSTDPGAAADFVRALVGERTWRGFSPSDTADVVSRSDTVRREVPQFLAFSPAAAQLRVLAGLPLVSSVGGESRSSRHLAAAAVAACTAGSPRVLAGVGHLAQIEAPAALALALRVAEGEALDGRPGGDEQILTAGRRDHLQADG
jgi:pimeloyl-ACP methyl ester carboxylesterase